jgi:hypothetical protein
MDYSTSMGGTEKHRILSSTTLILNSFLIGSVSSDASETLSSPTNTEENEHWIGENHASGSTMMTQEMIYQYLNENIFL